MTQSLPEVHFIGEILCGHKFSSANAFAKFDVESGDHWDCTGGDQSGQTQVDYPSMFVNKYVWNHPIDLHYFIKSVDGWPKIMFQVGNIDPYGGRQVFGYGVCHLPCSPGVHEIECPIWRVVGSTLQEAYSFFLDLKPRLTDTKLVSQNASNDRRKICTVAVGSVKLRISVLLRNFSKFSLEW
eukprot:CAMPEP_0202699664 /NCGR_PEP_ID=MMETSP1385-20130828/12874_1 /ASSEMBLY_ACC=CAM_ASM_000861 /TAXON_ID=933848 /ORGANISM="Elphidium margaritaceum" /LENGTH=182 /DNA_ID=CAMNT_0049356655 /DNA_START=24 /DNA_END=572 /DNA_ORIENTATION=-